MDNRPPATASTPRTRIARHPERGVDDPHALTAIVDEALVCHVAVLVSGTPRVLPTMHARIGDTLYLHGARHNALLGAALGPGEVCLCFTLLDGLVLAARAMHHSMNYRSAVVYGRAREVADEGEKRAALTALVERVGRGRSAEAAEPSPAELAATLVLAIPLAESSVKVRAEGPRGGEGAGYTGVIPLGLRATFPMDVGAPSLAALDALFTRAAPAVRPLCGAAEAASFLPSPADPHERTRDGLVFSSDLTRLELVRVHAFLRDESYWAQGLGYETFLRALTGSLCFGAYEGERQLGFARVVHDGARFGWLADVFVFPEARGRGVGKALVAHVLGHPSVVRLDRVLLGTRDAHSLYARHGFVSAPDGRYMVKPRAR
jgi:uncharacterized protein